MPSAQLLLFMAAFMFKRHHYNACPTNHHINTPYTQKKKLFNGTQHEMKQLVQHKMNSIMCPLFNFLLFSMVLLFSFHFHFWWSSSFPLLLTKFSRKKDIAQQKLKKNYFYLNSFNHEKML